MQQTVSLFKNKIYIINKHKMIQKINDMIFIPRFTQTIKLLESIGNVRIIATLVKFGSYLIIPKCVEFGCVYSVEKNHENNWICSQGHSHPEFKWASNYYSVANIQMYEHGESIEKTLHLSDQFVKQITRKSIDELVAIIEERIKDKQVSHYTVQQSFQYILERYTNKTY